MAKPAQGRAQAAAAGHAYFCFHAGLNDFLPPSRRGRRFLHRFNGRSAIKDMIEALGVPHPEVAAIAVNGRPVGFGHIVADGAEVEVFPSPQRLGGRVRKLQPPPLKRSRFVLDGHLGRLARDLRLLGFDTLYRNDYHDPELARISRQERRILLTRDVGLLKRSEVRRGLFLRETDPFRQLQEVLHRLELRRQVRPFTRCTACNGTLRVVAKKQLQTRVKPEILSSHARFRVCRVCHRVYWPGSHYDRLQERITQALALAASGEDGSSDRRATDSRDSPLTPPEAS